MARRAPGPSKTQPETRFPGLKPVNPDASTKIEYHELQQNEVLALEAIYSDDFVKHVATPGAWQVRPPTTHPLPRR